MQSFADFRQARCARVEKTLDQVLQAVDHTPQRLHQAMRYAVLNGGKRLRPLLVYAVGEALGADLNSLDIPATAVELIHAYSLVHDDLPAMDDDDLRRGKPSCHRAYDEATAILVGDALQSLAFEILAQTHLIPPVQRLTMLQILARASGSLGMAGGQSLDLQAIQTSLDLPQLESLYSQKTGALIQASVQLGAWSARAVDDKMQAAFDSYAQHLGLGFQICDDIGDIEGDLATLGKQPGNDDRHKKSTYPVLIGIEKARSHVDLLYQRSINALSSLGDKTGYLPQLAQYVLKLNS